MPHPASPNESGDKSPHSKMGRARRLRRGLQRQRLQVERLPAFGDGFDGHRDLAGLADLQFAQRRPLEPAVVAGVGRLGLQRSGRRRRCWNEPLPVAAISADTANLPGLVTLTATRPTRWDPARSRCCPAPVPIRSGSAGRGRWRRWPASAIVPSACWAGHVPSISKSPVTSQHDDEQIGPGPRPGPARRRLLDGLGRQRLLPASASR